MHKPTSLFGLLTYAYFLWVFTYSLIWVADYLPYLPYPLNLLYPAKSIGNPVPESYSSSSV